MKLSSVSKENAREGLDKIKKKSKETFESLKKYTKKNTEKFKEKSKKISRDVTDKVKSDDQLKGRFVTIVKWTFVTLIVLYFFATLVGYLFQISFFLRIIKNLISFCLVVLFGYIVYILREHWQLPYHPNTEDKYKTLLWWICFFGFFQNASFLMY